MWGQIVTEASIIQNFNCGFSTYKSEILVHLSQWQYWWWFWFALVWSLYFFFVLRLTQKRIMHFNPILNTSIRGHGKWGDFLVALIPLSWCGNILVNSNFILRMIEWQNESSLFTIRVQGKQWYWVYKYDASAAFQILTAPKNIGHNRWFFSVKGDSYIADSYYQLLHLTTQLEFQKMYNTLLRDNQFATPTFDTKSLIRPTVATLNFEGDVTAQPANLLVRGYYDLPALDDTSNFAANLLQTQIVQPFKIQRGVLNQHVVDLLTQSDKIETKLLLFNFKLMKAATVTEKVIDDELFWGFRQKKYKRLKAFYFNKPVTYNSQTFAVIGSDDARKSRLLHAQQLTQTFNSEDFLQAGDYYRAIKYNKHRSELVPVTLARRLLRTKRTLVLPAHVNLTVITNSYDVVHSWFIPGLGLKLDCVPGRSTHHTFYIDNVGFYYGQCAEICGRYHHHMPIRLCALPFEHFLVWWQTKGLPRLHRFANVNSQALTASQLVQYKYVW